MTSMAKPIKKRKEIISKNLGLSYLPGEGGWLDQLGHPGFCGPAI